MSDPAGILAHLQLVEAVGEFIEAMAKPSAISGTDDEVRQEIGRRTENIGQAYNRSLRWAKTVARSIQASDSPEKT